MMPKQAKGDRHRGEVVTVVLCFAEIFKFRARVSLFSSIVNLLVWVAIFFKKIESFQSNSNPVHCGERPGSWIQNLYKVDGEHTQINNNRQIVGTFVSEL